MHTRRNPGVAYALNVRLLTRGRDSRASRGLSAPLWQGQVLPVERSRGRDVQPAVDVLGAADAGSAEGQRDRGVRAVEELRRAGVPVAAPAVPVRGVRVHVQLQVRL